MLSLMGSRLASDMVKPQIKELPKIPLRLTKIPTDYGHCGENNLTSIKAFLPNVNIVYTPAAVVNSKRHQRLAEMIESNIPVTTVHTPCETVFSRVQDKDVMKERVQYHLIPYVPHGHMLTTGDTNL